MHYAKVVAVQELLTAESPAVSSAEGQLATPFPGQVAVMRGGVELHSTKLVQLNIQQAAKQHYLKVCI